MTKYKDDEGQKMKMMIVMINEKTKYDLKNTDKTDHRHHIISL